ncbi:MAG TPA: hypothetical protein VE987_06490 [Polyangiaceae bacterium]|nr:hypothetical protein [Polyangiaceae bacterium]
MRPVAPRFVSMMLDAVVLVAVVEGCSSHTGPPPESAALGVTAPQPEPHEIPLTSGSRAADLVQAADVEIGNLKRMRATAPDESTRQAAERELVLVSGYRDAVAADLSTGAEPQRVDADASNLERALRSASSASMQPAPVTPPPIERSTGTPGDGLAWPPYGR